MSNQITLNQQSLGAVSTAFAGHHLQEDDLAGGIAASFGHIGYKGKVWSVRYRGDEHVLMREDGDGPRNSIEVVIVKASPVVAKTFYENGYVEGSNAAPDCHSNNGIAPEMSSPKRQANACAACPMNQWGSRITSAGKQGKACSDVKRLAVVPATDIGNESFGGPMLLRVPAASLNDLATYGNALKQRGYPYYAVATRIAFDANEAFPKFVFNAIRALNDSEGAMVVQHINGGVVDRILNSDVAATEPQAVEQGGFFEQPPEQVAQQPVQQAVQQPVQQQPQQPQQVQPQVQQPVQQPVQQSGGFGATAPVQQPAQQVQPQQVQPQQVQPQVQPQVQQPVQQAVQQPVQQPVQQSGGFGATAPVQTPAQQQVAQQPVQQAAVQQPQQVADAGPTSAAQEMAGTGSAFETSLDDLLDKVMPSS